MISSAELRELRKELYEARVTRASERSPRDNDNGPLIQEALALRHELARLFQRQDYAALALQPGGLFRSPDEVERYLLARARSHRPRAQAELDALWSVARDEGVRRGFAVWDVPYYAAKLRQRELAGGSDEAELRAYFPLPSVQKGLFDASAQLLGLQIVPLTAATTSDADCHRVLDADGTELGSVEIEPFIQAGELEGARASLLPEGWNGRPCLRIHFGLPAPLDGALAQLGPREVSSVFGCWGQGLHRLLGASTPTSALAQHHAATASLIAGGLFERLALHAPNLQTYARHYQTGSALSPALQASLLRSLELQAGLCALQHVELALYDLRLHRDYVPAGKATQLRSHVLDTLAQVRRELSVLPPPYWERSANTWTRVFVDGRAARVWEEIHAAQAASDVFDALTASGFSFELTRALRELLWAPMSAVRLGEWLKHRSAPAA